MANNEQSKDESKKIYIEHVHIEDIEEDELPPAHIKSKFKTLEDWLANICDGRKPKQTIAEFKIGFFFDDSGQYTVFLNGVNSYQETKTRSVTRIQFRPANMYFEVPKEECKKFNVEQFKNHLSSQLKEFIQTEKFQTSFLTKSNAIITDFNGERIWSR